jgi:nucleoid-associated protein EbfC
VGPGYHMQAESRPSTCKSEGRWPLFALNYGCSDRTRMTNFQQLFQLGQQVQARLSQLQTELGNRTIKTSSGGGMVSVTADGKGRVREIKIDPSVVDPADVEMLEDLVLAALTEAQQRAEQVYEEEMKKVAGGFPLPFNLPGFP